MRIVLEKGYLCRFINKNITKYISSTKRLKNKRNILIKLTSLLAFFLISLSGIAQTALFSYQAVVRNSQNEIVANSTIGVRISLLRNSPSDPAEFA